MLQDNYDLVENGHKTEEELREEFMEHSIKYYVKREAQHALCPTNNEAAGDSFYVQEFKEVEI
jgi:hypothetical protein